MHLRVVCVCVKGGVLYTFRDKCTNIFVLFTNPHASFHFGVESSSCCGAEITGGTGAVFVQQPGCEGGFQNRNAGWKKQAAAESEVCPFFFFAFEDFTFKLTFGRFEHVPVPYFWSHIFHPPMHDRPESATLLRGGLRVFSETYFRPVESEVLSLFNAASCLLSSTISHQPCTVYSKSDQG